ncbi:VOC family protein [Kribbella sp. NPDC004536]|uniref:VOC family protein n=1 Tax=Kribbella sp. NPDC004536 TaxID=3364106 RepID=UPI0036A757FF
MADLELQNVVFACPGDSPESYAAGARPVARFYAELLGMRIVREDWFLVAGDGRLMLGFGDGPIDYQPPRWPDPSYPQQLHLDIAVPDLASAGARAVELGAELLDDRREWHVYADPIGHPFCLYPEATDRARIVRVVVDCPEPRALAEFYSALLDLPEVDTPGRIVLAGAPQLAFQRSDGPAPRWPDPAYPQQVHLDLFTDDVAEARAHAVSLGAEPLQTDGPDHHVYADPAGHPFCI